jgi:hypothetical protein
MLSMWPTNEGGTLSPEVNALLARPVKPELLAEHSRALIAELSRQDRLGILDPEAVAAATAPYTIAA